MNERGRISQMEKISNLCANKKIVHKDHAKKKNVPMAGQRGG
jgi:hypothetical protein